MADDVGRIRIEIEGAQAVRGYFNDLLHSSNQVGDSFNRTMRHGLLWGSTFGVLVGNITSRLFELPSQIARTTLAFTAASVQAKVLYDGMEMALGTILKSDTAAKGLLKSISAMEGRTPFKLQDLAQATTLMTAMGIEAGKIPSVLKTVGDASAVMGAGLGNLSGTLQEVALAIGRIASGGYGEAFERLRNLGIVTEQEMERFGHKAGEDYHKAFKTTAEALTAVLTIMQEKFGGGMERLSEKTGGILSTMQSFWFKFLREVGTGLDEQLNPALKGTRDALVKMEEDGDITKWGKETAGTLLDIYRNLLSLVGVDTSMLQSLPDYIRATGEAAQGVLKDVKAFVEVLRYFWEAGPETLMKMGDVFPRIVDESISKGRAALGRGQMPHYTSAEPPAVRGLGLDEPSNVDLMYVDRDKSGAYNPMTKPGAPPPVSRGTTGRAAKTARPEDPYKAWLDQNNMDYWLRWVSGGAEAVGPGWELKNLPESQKNTQREAGLLVQKSTIITQRILAPIVARWGRDKQPGPIAEMYARAQSEVNQGGQRVAAIGRTERDKATERFLGGFAEPGSPWWELEQVAADRGLWQMSGGRAVPAYNWAAMARGERGREQAAATAAFLAGSTGYAEGGAPWWVQEQRNIAPQLWSIQGGQLAPQRDWATLARAQREREQKAATEEFFRLHPGPPEGGTPWWVLEQVEASGGLFQVSGGRAVPSYKMGPEVQRPDFSERLSENMRRTWERAGRQIGDAFVSALEGKKVNLQGIFETTTSSAIQNIIDSIKWGSPLKSMGGWKPMGEGQLPYIAAGLAAGWASGGGKGPGRGAQMGTALGSFLPGNPQLGAMIGGLIGGLFDRQKRANDWLEKIYGELRGIRDVMWVTPAWSPASAAFGGREFSRAVSRGMRAA